MNRVYPTHLTLGIQQVFGRDWLFPVHSQLGTLKSPQQWFVSCEITGHSIINNSTKEKPELDRTSELTLSTHRSLAEISPPGALAPPHHEFSGRGEAKALWRYCTNPIMFFKHPANRTSSSNALIKESFREDIWRCVWEHYFIAQIHDPTCSQLHSFKDCQRAKTKIPGPSLV